MTERLSVEAALHLAGAPHALSGRQRDVLIGMLRGESLSETADRLHVTRRTIKYHRTEVLRWCNATSQRELQGRLVQSDDRRIDEPEVPAMRTTGDLPHVEADE